MTNPFRTDLIAIFVRRGHKGKEIVEMVKEIEALLDGQRCVWTYEDDGFWHMSCGGVREMMVDGPFCPCCSFKIEVKDGQ